MRTWLEHGDVATEDPDPGEVGRLVAAGTPFWLDIEDPTDEIIDHMAERLGLHALAVEDSKRFDQRGKLVVYGDVAMMIGFGIDTSTGDPVEVHSYIAPGLHRDVPPAAQRRPRRGSTTPDRCASCSAATLCVSSTTPSRPCTIRTATTSTGWRSGSSAVEQEMVGEPLDSHLVEIADIRRRADWLRRTLTPGRDDGRLGSTDRHVVAGRLQREPCSTPTTCWTSSG